jgi:hypothetical protein
MAFCFVDTKKYLNSRGIIVSRKIGNYICDYCGNQFVGGTKQKLISQELHFCSRYCSNLSAKKGGKIFEKKKHSSIIKYGCEHHSANTEVQNKRIDTCISKFGGRSPQSNPDIKSKIHNSILSKFGDHFSRSLDVKNKKKKTCIEKYGVDSYSKTQKFKDSINWQDVNRKGFNTRKLNGLSPVSKIEVKFLEFLKIYFTEIQTQVSVDKWFIDFYIPSVDCYVQFNGNYWHGLDKSYEELIGSSKPRDKIIAATKLRDVEKQKYFKDNNLILINIPELDFKLKKYEKILIVINSKA